VKMKMKKKLSVGSDDEESSKDEKSSDADTS
jgi:hypothetical protein